MDGIANIIIMTRNKVELLFILHLLSFKVYFNKVFCVVKKYSYFSFRFASSISVTSFTFFSDKG